MKTFFAILTVLMFATAAAYAAVPANPSPVKTREQIMAEIYRSADALDSREAPGSGSGDSGSAGSGSGAGSGSSK